MPKHFYFLIFLLTALGLQSCAKTADEFKNAKVHIHSVETAANQLHLYIEVSDAAGKPIVKLEKENIDVFYAGKPIAVDSVVETESRAIIFAIDFSGSMDNYVGSKTKFQSAKEAVVAYMDSLIKAPDDMAIVAFDSCVHQESDFLHDKNELQQSLARAKRYPNGTALLDGIKFALEKFEPDAESKLLVVITDGMDTETEKRIKKQFVQQGISFTQEQIDQQIRIEREKVIKLARQNDIKIFTIGIGERKASDGRKAVDELFLKQLAQQTDGKYSYYAIAALPESHDSDSHAVTETLTGGLLRIFHEIDTTSHDSTGHGEYKLVLPWFNQGIFDYKRMRIRLSKPWLEKVSAHEAVLVFLTPLLILLIIPALAAVSFDGVWFTLKWVKTVKANLSLKGDWDDRPLLERICSYCRMPFQSGQKIVICPQCRTVHHCDCWTSNENHCAARVGCGGYGKPLV